VVTVEIGVLALQGGFLAHASALRERGASVREVRRCDALEELDGLIIPGGETTTLLNLMGDEPWFDRLRSFHGRGGALFGTCAGAILLAREVVRPEQPSLGLLDAVVERNAYGRQRESFETKLDVAAVGGSIEAVFIRAPRFLSLGPGVEVLGRLDGEPVLVRQERVLAGTFHPELTGDSRLHGYFLELTAGATARARQAS
jgi:5'-phosphate synthase pdxT subunit